jgi:carboxypeptidase C (cathepsin A)
MSRKIAIVLVLGMTIIAGRAQQTGTQAVIEVKSPEAAPRRLQAPADSITESTVTIGGQQIEYRAVAGTITVGGTDAYDALITSDGQLLPDAVVNPTDPAKPEDAPARGY